ncbi:hypothetical protein Micbo1qcDRAFT_172006 [Microdochium bolleyi]|uniref:BZIP domain-containing protein n=1 Tax=Microdochium bolleyi TaxID=196109 RepID=A0A136JEV2_9PEZI|nr:hypothetical protein Micbo1qcDRAFT_172006 [Microdochium bolleyi]
MDAKQIQAQGQATTCNNWFQGVACTCATCEYYTSDALSGFMLPNSLLDQRQNALIDPRMLLQHTDGLPDMPCHGWMASSPVQKDEANASKLGSPIQLSHAQPTPTSGLNNFTMLPMPSLPPQQSAIHSSSTNHSIPFNTHSRVNSFQEFLDTRPRASSINTIASSDLSDAFSPNYFGTPGSDVQAATPFSNPHHHGSPVATTSQQQQSPPSQLSAILSLPNTLSSSSVDNDDNPTTMAASLQKPKPYDRAKNNCAAKKSRQRRLDLIRDLQDQLARRSEELDALAAKLATLKTQLAGVQTQCGELQRHNAELLQNMVSSQQDVMSSRALKEENTRLRADIENLQALVRSLALTQQQQAGAASGAAGSGSATRVGSPSASSMEVGSGSRTAVLGSPFSLMGGDDYFS